MREYTVIVPTHNRHDYLARSIEYFSNFDAAIIYVDSSEQPFRGRIHPNVSYFHCPLMTFPEKSKFALNKCGTEYVAFCADDDFLVEEALCQGLDQFEEKQTLAASVGYFVGFNERFNGEFFKIYTSKPWPDVGGEPKNNILNLLSDYRQILWSLYRRDVIASAYDVIHRANFSNDNFIELVVATLCAGRGGVAFVNSCWGAREISDRDHWGRRHEPLRAVKDRSKIENDINKFITEVGSVVGHDNAVLAIKSYLAASTPGKGKAFLKRLVPKRITSRAKTFWGVNLQCLVPVAQILTEHG